MTKQNPFSLYDFLGYLIPGALVIYTFLIVSYLKLSPSYSINSLIDNFSRIQLEDIFIFIVASYSLGHLLSFLSSITIERYANWMYGYPSKYLLGYQHRGYWGGKPSWKVMFWRSFLILFLLPCMILDYILGHYLGMKEFYQKSLDPLLKDLIKYKIEKLLENLGMYKIGGYNSETIGEHDFHRIVTHYTFEHSKQHQFRMTNYVALFGFLRNLSLLFNALAWYYFFHIILFYEFTLRDAFISFTLMATSYIFFMAFMKFYRRYTLEGFMLIAINENLV